MHLGGLKGDWAAKIRGKVHGLSPQDRSWVSRTAIEDFNTSIDMGEANAHLKPTETLYRAFVNAVCRVKDRQSQR